jgi:hypothetical protein
MNWHPILLAAALFVVLITVGRCISAEIICYPILPNTLRCVSVQASEHDGEWVLAPGLHFQPVPRLPIDDWAPPTLREVEPGYLGPHTKPPFMQRNERRGKD